jgi:hypothetical protein
MIAWACSLRAAMSMIALLAVLLCAVVSLVGGPALAPTFVGLHCAAHSQQLRPRSPPSA